MLHFRRPRLLDREHLTWFFASDTMYDITGAMRFMKHYKRGIPFARYGWVRPSMTSYGEACLIYVWCKVTLLYVVNGTISWSGIMQWSRRPNKLHIELAHINALNWILSGQQPLCLYTAPRTYTFFLAPKKIN